MVTTSSSPSQNSLRAEHVEHTRQRLLQAAIDVILDEGADELSLRAVAEKAGVSAPTAYRHFPTKTELFDAVITFIDERMHIPKAIRSIEDFIEALPVIHQSFADNERLMRAYLRATSELRLAGRKNRARRVHTATRRSLQKLPEPEIRALAAVLQLFSSSTSWELWRDLWNLDGAVGGRVAAWAVKALYESARRDPAGLERAVAGTTEPNGTAEGKKGTR